MIIRLAEERDLPYLLDIYNYEVEHGVATFDLNLKTMEEWREWFFVHGSGRYPLIVGEIDGRAAGYASLSPYRAKEAYAATVELSLYVAPEYRRRGIARGLMEEILKYAKGREDLHTVISVITSGNEASTRLHREFGFTYCGTIKETGKKFGRFLDIDNYQLILGEKGSGKKQEDFTMNTIEELLNTYMKSVNTEDLSLADQLWLGSEEDSFIHPRGHQVGKENIKNYFYVNTMYKVFSKRELKIKNVLLHEMGDYAVATFYWDFHATRRADGVEIDNHGRESQFLVKTEDGWKITHIHYSRMPEE